ncbi:MAG: hypothetical protein ACD_75C01803G0002 [uncultured bacterium]|nr:MAG: hypothetical protein ACD_75C01803G0002 [uncultured bacterium]
MVAMDDDISVMQLGKEQRILFWFALFLAAEPHLSEQFALGEEVEAQARQGKSFRQRVIAEKKRLVPFASGQMFERKRCRQNFHLMAVFAEKFGKILGMSRRTAADHHPFAAFLPGVNLGGERSENAELGAIEGDFLFQQLMIAGGYGNRLFIRTGKIGDVQLRKAGQLPDDLILQQKELGGRQGGVGHLPGRLVVFADPLEREIHALADAFRIDEQQYRVLWQKLKDGRGRLFMVRVEERQEKLHPLKAQAASYPFRHAGGFLAVPAVLFAYLVDQSDDLL